MFELVLLMVGVVLVNTLELAKPLGLAPFLSGSNRLDSAYGTAILTIFVLPLSAMLSYPIYHWLLAPLKSDLYFALTSALMIAPLAQLIVLVEKRYAPPRFRVLHIFLPLTAINCTLLSMGLLHLPSTRSWLAAILCSLGIALSFALMLIVFAAMHERLQTTDVPTRMRGIPIVLVSAGIMLLALVGFTGLA